MLSVLALLSCLITPPSATVTVAGDSVVLVVAVADNATPQAVSVDSVAARADIGAFGSELARTVVKSAGVTTIRFAWAKANWGANQTRGSTIKVKLGRIAAGCAGGVCWSAETTGPTWSYTLDATAPAVPEAGAITVQSVGLN